MGIVNVKNLKKLYGEFLAVDDISFSIKRGEVFGFLGPNGAGKTSTINMMIGLSKPSGGTIAIDGLDGIKDVKKVQSIIGVIPDENNLYDEMDGFDNLCFCGSLYGMGKTEREGKARKLLEQFHLDKVGKRPFRAYSKGMKRKLTIAAGIIHNPKILFMDEPTTGIDVESARQIRELILDLKRQGKTIFLTTHYLEDAERICDKIAFIVKGRIVKIGKISELMKNAGREHKIKIVLDDGAAAIKDELENLFPAYGIRITEDNSCIITSKGKIALFPIIQTLDSMGIAVLEAEEIKPTLEEVFISITGTQADNLQKEKAGMGN